MLWCGGRRREGAQRECERKESGQKRRQPIESRDGGGETAGIGKEMALSPSWKWRKSGRVRRILLSPRPPAWAITTDASPPGLGAILSSVDFSTGQITPVVALEMNVSRNMAATLGVPFPEAAGQASLEAWAILLGVRFWRAKIKGDKLLIKSNSTVALSSPRG